MKVGRDGKRMKTDCIYDQWRWWISMFLYVEYSSSSFRAVAMRSSVSPHGCQHGWRSLVPLIHLEPNAG